MSSIVALLALDDSAFKEADHPRDSEGKFTSGAGSISGALEGAGFKKSHTAGNVTAYTAGKHNVNYDPTTGKWAYYEMGENGAKGVYAGKSLKGLEEHLADLGLSNAVAAKPVALSSLTKTGDKPGGSNPGGTYIDPSTGDEWIVKGNNAQAKTGDKVSDERAANEVLAAELMKLAGIGAPEMRLVDLQGQYGAKKEGPGSLGVATKWMNLSAWKGTPEQVKAMQEQFAVHAWLANYDVMGMGNDNVMLNIAGQPINIDPGGALLFRAQGQPKLDFGDDASEWDTMRDTDKNPWAGAVFGKMDKAALFNSAKKLSAISNDQITDMVQKAGPGSASDKAALATTLIARKNAILQKASAGMAPIAAPASAPANQLTATEKDYIVNSHVGKVINAAGFKKAKDDAQGNLTYVHPSGAKVVVHPPASGKKSSSKFTHFTKGDPLGLQGEGVPAITKLLGQVVKAAEAKKAPAVVAHPMKQADDSVLSTYGFKPVNSSGGQSTYQTTSGMKLAFYHSDKSFVLTYPNGTESIGQGVGELNAFLQKPVAKSAVAPAAQVPLVGKTAPSEELKPYINAAGGGVNVAGYLTAGKGYSKDKVQGTVHTFKKGSDTVEVDGATGKWLSKSPGKQTKEGEGAGSLSVLLSGQKPAKPYPWTNTSTESLYVDPAAAEKAAAEKKLQAVANKVKAEAEAAAKAKKQAEFGEYMKKVEAANAAAGATQKALMAAAPKPTNKQMDAIGSYTGSGYGSMNDKLRHQPGYSSPSTEEMDAYLGKAKFPKDVIVFRKVSGEYSKILKSIITEGTKFVDHGYISTTTHSGVWSGDMQFVITVKAGQRGASVKEFSSHSSENEVILPRSSAFVVKKYDRESGIAYVELDQSHLESKWAEQGE